ncbi:hypothetical protein DES36_11447 [Alkalibaculum bacchi]|uniref:Uncharacterized protein n=1 Tax=Alkalibaculum bacchi TaxID=645887 RepID=A0A366I201_9FIRM|nr:hypothetical protein [Alkalibaculum bacchi]RBP61365.1 hypothetical protein DES36_11447 [Alkalibaculum bacchi]
MSDEIGARRDYKKIISYENALQNTISSINDTIVKLSIAKERNLIGEEGYEELKTLALELNEMLCKIKEDI